MDVLLEAFLTILHACVYLIAELNLKHLQITAQTNASLIAHQHLTSMPIILQWFAFIIVLLGYLLTPQPEHV